MHNTAIILHYLRNRISDDEDPGDKIELKEKLKLSRDEYRIYDRAYNDISRKNKQYIKEQNKISKETYKQKIKDNKLIIKNNKIELKKLIQKNKVIKIIPVKVYN